MRRGAAEQQKQQKTHTGQDNTGNSEEGSHVEIQIEMGSRCYVGTRQAAAVGYSSRFSQ